MQQKNMVYETLGKYIFNNDGNHFIAGCLKEDLVLEDGWSKYTRPLIQPCRYSIRILIHPAYLSSLTIQLWFRLIVPD
jgi:hypothetical protein